MARLRHRAIFWLMLRALLLLGLTSLFGCGGKVVFDGTGGAGGNRSVSSSPTGSTSKGSTHAATSGSTSSGPNDCASLEKAFQDLFNQATACNACLDSNPCMGGIEIIDSCGCPAGTADQALAKQAQHAYDVWVAGGCGPHLCQVPCGKPGGSWSCGGNGMSCSGTCQAIFF